MRIVVALGGNALLRRGEPLTAEAQRANVRIAAKALEPIAREHSLIVSHGNGPQVGLLALQGAAYKPEESYPLDVLGAETEGMIGYMIEQELGNLLPPETHLATILTMVEVYPDDPAFLNPTKFIGLIYEKTDAEGLASEKGWVMKKDGQKWRRVVPSPRPQRIFEIEPIRWLADKGTIVICAGGGGIPTAYDNERNLHGVEAVVDKDLASELLARDLGAGLLILATDVDAAYINWGTPTAKAIKRATPDQLKRIEFPAGSMGPKIDAACEFVEATGNPAAIGALGDLPAILDGTAGTTITPRASGLELY